jgi:catechol-2,3-dioxygenase
LLGQMGLGGQDLEEVLSFYSSVIQLTPLSS